MNGAAARSAAFLQEMGIGPLWTMRAHAPEAEGADAEAADASLDAAPAAATVAAPVAAAPRPAPVQRPAPRPAPAQDYAPVATTVAALGAVDEPPPAGPTDEEIAVMDWDELRAGVAACTRCSLCRNGAKPVFGSGAQQARWLVAAGASTAADQNEGVPLAGEPGKLLVNMLAAVALAQDSNAYVTNLIKCRPTSANGGDRAPCADEAAACRPFLERELALTGAGMVLTLGQIAANALLGKPLQAPLAGARGTLHQVNAVTMVSTLHPGELLQRGTSKALAWADLCLAKSADASTG